MGGALLFSMYSTRRQVCWRHSRSLQECVRLTSATCVEERIVCRESCSSHRMSVQSRRGRVDEAQHYEVRCLGVMAVDVLQSVQHLRSFVRDHSPKSTAMLLNRARKDSESSDYSVHVSSA